MLEVGVARTFRAVHQVPEAGAPPHGEAPEREPHRHEHDYRVEAVVRGEVLSDDGMLLDIDLLDSALAHSLRDLDGSDLDTLPAFAGRTTTVEIVAQHIWHRVRARIAGQAELGSLRVTVHESADAWAAVDLELGA